MRNIVLARVDDRLISAKIVATWLPAVSATRIVIVDNEMAGDRFATHITKALAPAGTTVSVCTEAEAVEELMAEGAPGERLMVLTKTPVTFNRLVGNGVPLKEINLGDVGLCGGRRHFVGSASLDAKEVRACEELRKAGCRVYYQMIPQQRVVEIDDVMERAEMAS